MRRFLPGSESRWWPALFFTGFLGLGLSVVGDFGINIDELTNHYFGARWADYVVALLFQHAPLGPLAGATEHDVVHGPFFEILLAFIERAAGLTTIPALVLFRHAATWAIFYLAVVCFYFLGQRLFASRAFALFGCVLLVVHPRIFSHSFYDSIDLPFLSFYIFSLFTLVRWRETRSLGRLAWHAVVCACLVDVRAIGGIIPALTGWFLLTDLVPASVVSDSRPRRVLKLIVFFALLGATTILFWPFLWNNPPQRLLEVLHLTAKVNWDGLVLYLGREINATKLPWHYIPVWILISTPLAIVALWFVGTGTLLTRLALHPVTTGREHSGMLLALTAALGPILAVIATHAVVFDAWRHMFFVYPALVLLAVFGAQTLLAAIDARLTARSRQLARGFFTGAVALNLLFAVWFMVRSHPYENVYFNRLAGANLVQIRSRFEFDFWGLAYRRALEHLVAYDRSPALKVYRGHNALLAINRQMLPPADDRRIVSTELADAQYVLTTFRPDRAGYPELPIFYRIQIDGADLVCVYRRPTPAP